MIYNTYFKIIYNNLKYKIFNSLPIKFPCINAIKVNDTAVFNPVKYMMGLKEIIKDNNIKIYEKTKIVKLERTDDGYIAFTDKYKIRTKKVVLACFYPFFLKPFLINACSISNFLCIIVLPTKFRK